MTKPQRAAAGRADGGTVARGRGRNLRPDPRPRGSGLAVLMVEQNALLALEYGTRGIVLVAGKQGPRRHGGAAARRTTKSGICSWAAHLRPRTSSNGNIYNGEELNMTQHRSDVRFLRAGRGRRAHALRPACSFWAQAGGPIRIGLIIPLTGATSQFGATMGQAAKIAVDRDQRGRRRTRPARSRSSSRTIRATPKPPSGPRASSSTSTRSSPSAAPTPQP